VEGSRPMMSTLLKVARLPPVSVSETTKVIDAVRLMIENRVGAVLVLEEGSARGIFTERDVFLKVVPGEHDPKTTPVSAVMTTPVLTIRHDASREGALAQMIDHHIHHLPVVDDAEKVVGMLTMRHLMRTKIDTLKAEVNSLANYAGSDGI